MHKCLRIHLCTTYIISFAYRTELLLMTHSWASVLLFRMVRDLAIADAGKVQNGHTLEHLVTYRACMFLLDAILASFLVSLPGGGNSVNSPQTMTNIYLQL